MTPRRLVTSIAVTALAACLLAACTSAVSQRQNSTGSASAAPVRGGTITVAQTTDALPGSILSGKAGNYPWLQNVFEGLTKFDKSYTPQPLIATSWTVAPDQLSIDIHLRDDVKFQTGRPMTADDVKWTFEKAADKATGSQLGFIARMFTAIDVVSPTELKISFTQPLPNIFEFFEQTVIVDKDTYAGLADGSKVIGTGPYTFGDWQQGASFVLKRWDGYRDPSVANVDEIDYAVISDQTALLNAVRSGRAQVAYGLNNTDVESFASDKRYQILDTGGAMYPLGVNVTQPPFDKKEVRQAVAYAIDRERINKQVFSGTGTLTDLFWTPSEPGYPSDLANYYTYDPEKAKKMIADAGATGAAVPITVISLPQTQQMAQIIANNLEAIGLKPEIKITEVATFASDQVAGNLGTAFMPLHGQVGYSAVTMLDSLPSLRQSNSSKFWPAEYQTLRKNLQNAATADAKATALHALSKYMLDEAFSVIVLQAPGLTLQSADIHGMTISPIGAVSFVSAYTTAR